LRLSISAFGKEYDAVEIRKMIARLLSLADSFTNGRPAER
jgi:hypothetical protein